MKKKIKKSPRQTAIALIEKHDVNTDECAEHSESIYGVCPGCIADAICKERLEIARLRKINESLTEDLDRLDFLEKKIKETSNGKPIKHFSMDFNANCETLRHAIDEEMKADAENLLRSKGLQQGTPEHDKAG